MTMGYAVPDSPIALARRMLDHNTDSYYKISRACLDRQSAGRLTRDRIVDKITPYWLTGTGVSAARSHREKGCCAALPSARLLRSSRFRAAFKPLR